ncbi:MMPL family transporter [Mycolicibacterium moriokaense]|uniref:MMPL family transporter n=1 Tax=Mycolicibacterium moriokaense TaxID=39691 RepID=UPI001F36DD58|nr:MMPL family transporter [Mycolicibacterium moriokaense]
MRRPKVILIAVLALLGISIVFGATVTQKLGVGGFTDPAAESAQVADYLDKHFPTTPNLVLEVVARDGVVANPDVTATADRVWQLIEAEPAAKVVGSFSQAADLRSRDGRFGLILVHVGGTLDEATKTAIRIIDGLPTDDPAVDVRAGGPLGVSVETEDRVNHDLVISESIALPISLAVLVIIFGGLVAAFLPLAIGITSIVTTLLVLTIMASITDVSVHALTVATAFGLGLSIDFGLLMVSRFREERDLGKDHEAAIIATVTSAGRTIIFSAATVTLAMSGLLVFPTYFLRSTALTGSAVVILSALSAIVVLPALLAVLGKRIDSLAVIRRKVPLSADSLFWRRCAAAVTKRPLLWALPVIAMLLVLGIPFLGVQLAMPDERALPPDSNARLVAESLRNNYATDSSQAVTLLARNDVRALDDLAAPVSLMDGVVRVVAPSGTYERGKAIAGPTPGFENNGAGYGLVSLSAAAQTNAAQQVVHAIRGKIVDHQVEVGGPTATLIDTSAGVGDRLPLAILLIALATFVLLFLFTGSIVVPIKALVLNLLMLSAVLGAMVWIFQDGHLASLLGVTPAPLNLSMVVLLCCIAFSLSVDYEIFLLSRIKEARDSGLSNNDAIVVGLGRVGRIISSAALLLTITLLSFANGLSFMKMFGIGTALAIVIDATVIRGVVVPAFLRVAGELNWWAPAPLRWLHARIGLSEAPAEPKFPPPAPRLDEEIRRLTPTSAPEPRIIRHPPPAPRLDEETVRLAPTHAPEPDTIRHPTPTPQQDEETVRLAPTHAPEPDTIRHPTPTPQQDEETVRLAPTHAPEPDTIRHPTPTPQQDEETVRLAPTSASEPDTIRHPTPTTQLRQLRGYVVLDDNSRFDIDQDCLIGCAPNNSDAAGLGLRPIRIDDRTGEVSNAHAEIRWVNSEVVIVDRESANGVFMCAPGQRAWTRLTPWHPTPWPFGASVRIGNRILELEAPLEGARGESS